jgi:signal transduction histidine kinase
VPPDLDAIADRVLVDEADAWRDGTGAGGEPYRLLAMPTYDDRDRLAGVIVAVGDPRPGRRSWLAFTGRLAVGAAALIGFGLLGSALLARELYARMHAGIQERERFLAAAAHELRTPIATMLAVIESARAGDEPASAALVRLDGIATTTGALVERLLAWVRLEAVAPETEPVRLDLLVETLLQPGEAADLEETVVACDPKLVMIAVDNVLRNARTHGRGVREVRVRGDRVVVLDHGMGFPASADPTTPFVKDAGSSGAGLGLALVARIVAAHGGVLRLGPGGEVSMGFGPAGADGRGRGAARAASPA